MLMSIMGFIILLLASLATIILEATGIAIICIETGKYIEKNYFED